MTSPNEEDWDVRRTEPARPEDEQWWADRIAAHAAEREHAQQGSADQPGSGGTRPTGVRSAWAALGGGLSNGQGSGYVPSYQSRLGDLSTLGNVDAARSALFLLILAVIAGIGAALAFVVMMAIVAAATGL